MTDISPNAREAMFNQQLAIDNQTLSQENVHLQAENAKLASELDAAKKALIDKDNLLGRAALLLEPFAKLWDVMHKYADLRQVATLSFDKITGNTVISKSENSAWLSSRPFKEAREFLQSPNTAKAAAMQAVVDAAVYFVEELDLNGVIYGDDADLRAAVQALRATEGQAESGDAE